MRASLIVAVLLFCARTFAGGIDELDATPKLQAIAVSGAVCYARSTRTYYKAAIVKQRKRDAEIGERDRPAWAEIRTHLDEADGVQERASAWLSAHKIKPMPCTKYVQAISLCLPDDDKGPCGAPAFSDIQRWLSREGVTEIAEEEVVAPNEDTRVRINPRKMIDEALHAPIGDRVKAAPSVIN